MPKANSSLAFALRSGKLLLRFVVLPLALLAGAYYGRQAMIESKVAPKRRAAPKAKLHVEARPMAPQAFTVVLRTRGTVSARTQSRLASEVQGRVLSVADSFRVGAQVRAGDVLVVTTRTLDLPAAKLQLEQAKVALRQAEAARAEVKQQLANGVDACKLAVERHALAKEQLARVAALREKNVVAEAVAEDAEREELVARIAWRVQVDACKLLEARITSADAAIERARVAVASATLAVEQVEIKAPFDGIVLRRRVDVGEIVSRGAELGALFAADVVELRLPLAAYQEDQLGGPNGQQVTLTRDGHSWTGTIERLEGAVDPSTRQLIAVATVKTPYAGETPLRVGSFVQAEIKGRVHQDVVVVPRSALQRGDQLLVIEGSGESAHVARRRVEVSWREADVALISGGLKPGDRLCLTAVVFAGERAPVVVAGEEPPKTAQRKGGQRPQ